MWDEITALFSIYAADVKLLRWIHPQVRPRCVAPCIIVTLSLPAQPPPASFHRFFPAIFASPPLGLVRARRSSFRRHFLRTRRRSKSVAEAFVECQCRCFSCSGSRLLPPPAAAAYCRLPAPIARFACCKARRMHTSIDGNKRLEFIPIIALMHLPAVACRWKGGR